MKKIIDISKHNKKSKLFLALTLLIIFLVVVAVVFFFLIKNKVIFSSKETNNQVSVTSVENNKITNSQIDAGQAAASGKYDSAIKTIDEQLSSTTDNDIKYRLFMQKSAILVNKSDLSSAYDAAISAYKISKTANSAANVAYVLAKMNKNSDAISYYKIAISLIDSSDPMSGTDKTYYQSLIDNLGK